MPSAVIRRIDYDEASRELRVSFVSGDVYAYDEVPREAYEAFRATFSKGRHFAAHVRDRYRCRRLSRDGREDEWPDVQPSLLR
jgi:lysyl-tRNA synthetase class 2